MTMAPSKEVGTHFTPWGTFHISVSPVFFEMTENIEWLRLEGASRDHLVHSHLAQAGPPWAHFPGLCPGAFWSPGHPEDLMVEQGAGHPEPLIASSTSPSRNSEYRHCPGLHPLLLLVQGDFLSDLSSLVLLLQLSLMQQAPWAGEHTITKAPWSPMPITAPAV